MRSKEEAHDYRYFPDPDLLPLELTHEWIEGIRKTLPELPFDRARRFQSFYALPEYDSFVLTAEKETADFYELVAEESKNPKAASNWIMVELMRELKDHNVEISKSPISAKGLAELIQMIDSNAISGKIAKAVFKEMWSSGESPEKIVKAKGMVQITDPKAIEEIVEKTLAASPAQVEQYRSGKDKLFGFFVGQIMKETKGQANPELVNEELKRQLKGD